MFFLCFLNAIFLMFLAVCCNVVSCVRRGWRRQQVTRGMTVGRAVGEGDRRVARWVLGLFKLNPCLPIEFVTPWSSTHPGSDWSQVLGPPVTQRLTSLSYRAGR